MNSLIFHELKKLFSNKILLIVTILLLFANAFNIYQTNDKYHDKYNLDVNEAQWQLYEEVEGVISADKTNWLYEYTQKLQSVISGESEELSFYYLNSYGDLSLATNLLNSIENANAYSDRIDELIEKNNEQLEIYKQKGNKYLIKKAQLVNDTYSARQISSFYNVDAYDTYFGYDFSSFLILLIVFLCTASLYAGENETGMLALMRSTPMGRLRLSNAKQTAMVIYTGAVCMLFFVCDLLMFLWCLRLRGIANPVYSMSSFEYSPLIISIGNFIILSSLLKYLGFVCFALISCVFSSLLKKAYMVFVADFVVCICFMFMSVYSGGVLDYLNLINPINMLLCRDMFSSFNVVNIFDTPVFRYVISFICTALFVCILSVFINLLNNTNSRAKRCIK